MSHPIHRVSGPDMLPVEKIRTVQRYRRDDGVEIDALTDAEQLTMDDPLFLARGNVLLSPDHPPIPVEFMVEARTIQEAFARYREHLDRAGRDLVQRLQQDQRRIVVAKETPR